LLLNGLRLTDCDAGQPVAFADSFYPPCCFEQMKKFCSWDEASPDYRVSYYLTPHLCTAKGSFVPAPTMRHLDIQQSRRQASLAEGPKIRGRLVRFEPDFQAIQKLAIIRRDRQPSGVRHLPSAAGFVEVKSMTISKCLLFRALCSLFRAARLTIQPSTRPWRNSDKISAKCAGSAW
jgi:hypothetical protein